MTILVEMDWTNFVRFKINGLYILYFKISLKMKVITIILISIAKEMSTLYHSFICRC